MFEDSRQTNRFEITRNQKENTNNNKLISYFQNSTFLAQQEELSTFIKNLPLIKFQQINSLNKLIEVLIRQNEVLGNKCQQNVLTVKQMFYKHEQLVRNNRELQQRLKLNQQEMEHHSISQHQMISYEEKINTLKQENKQKNDTISQLKEMTEQLMEQNKHCLGSLQDVADIIKNISERNYKKSIDKVKELNYANNKEHWEWIDLDVIEKYIKEEKKRVKYIPKVRQTVQSFCHRFIKISQYVSGQMIKSQFNKEVNNMLEILDDLLLLKKRSNSNSQSRFTQYNSDCNFFEGLLDKILKERDNRTNSKEEIAEQLEIVRQELQQSKKYYEEYLMKTKFECEELVRRKEEELTEKNQLLGYYQTEKEKTTVQTMQMRQKLRQIEQCLKIERLNGEVKTDQITSLQKKLEQVKNQAELKEQQLKSQWQQNTNTYEYKLAQKLQLLQEEQKQRKSLKTELQEQKADFKRKISQSQQRQKQLCERNRMLTDTVDDLNNNIDKLKRKIDQQAARYQQQIEDKGKYLEESIRKRQKQNQIIKRLKQEIEDSQKEKALQAAYIKELQQKNKDLVSKLKSLENKKNEEKTVKKQMDSIKKTFMEEKKHSREVEQTLINQKSQNQKQKEEIIRLKAIIKQMKKQLEQVYHQLTNLKVIENDRQKLLLEMQKSDRLRQQLFKNSEYLKVELQRSQQENKGLSLEVKHYKNALSRIQALRL